MAEGTLDITISNQVGTPPVTISSISALYNFWAVMTGKLFLSGWHAADNTDWDDLVAYCGSDDVAGGKLKQTGTISWEDPNVGATNEFGLSITGSGVRLNDGTFVHLGIMAWYWLYFEVDGYGREVNFWNNETRMTSNGYFGGDDLRQGFSVRGVADSTDKVEGQTGTMIDYDGNIYNTICINGREWMTSNLRVSHFNDGSVIPNIIPDAEWTALTTEAMCYYGNATPPVPPIVPHGNPPEYEIFIAESSYTYQVFPLNFLSTSLVDEQENNEVFYRRKFNGSLIFGSNSRVKDSYGNWHDRCDDWALFWGVEQTDPCMRLYIQINKIVSGIVYPYWDGYFSTTDGKFDIDKQLFEITPTVNDEYSLILENTKTQYDILIGTPEVSTNANDGVSINQTYTHNHWLIDVMDYLLNPGGLPVTATISSEFFTNATNPVTLDASKTNMLTIAQKSDIKFPGATNPAHYPLGVLSWNELMEILKGMFQVYWKYDHLTDIVHVEHISWFVANDGLDLRTQALCQATNKYSYVKEKMPKYEKFNWMEANNIEFIGVPIRYESQCVDQNKDTNTTETSLPVTTDIEFIYNNAHRDAGASDKISDEGWVILQNSGSMPVFSVDMELAAGGSDVKLNMHLSWNNLHNNYFRHNRVIIEGFINNTFTTFISAQKTKKQECSAIICSGYNPDDNITTELGEIYFLGEKAKVGRAELRPTGEIKFSLLYGTHYVTPTPIPPSKWIQIVMVPGSGCTHFHAVLSEGAPVGGLNIEFRYVIIRLGVGICANNTLDDVWSIAEGLTSDDYDITLDCAIPSDGCIYYWRPGPNVIPGWVIDFVWDETCRC